MIADIPKLQPVKQSNRPPQMLKHRVPPNTLKFFVAPVLVAIGLLPAAVSAQLVGAGSSLARDLMGAWTKAYGVESGGASYEAIGSSKGFERAKDGTVDFGVSDVPSTSVLLKQSGLKQFPLAAAAVVVVVNLVELKGKLIRLDGDLLADIYQGKITNWNHQQIAAANPGVQFPDRKITPVWRTDGSGQSYVFSSYVSRGNMRWRKAIGPSTKLNLSVGLGVEGGQAIIKTVGSTDGGIGYESLNAAQKAGLTIAELRNASGAWVGPKPGSIAEALNRAQWVPENNSVDLDGSAGSGTYPMATVIYALLPAVPKAGRSSALTFVQSAVKKGDTNLASVGLIAIPEAGKKLVLAGL